MATDKRQELKQLRALQEQSAALVHLFQALNEHFDSLNKNVGAVAGVMNNWDHTFKCMTPAVAIPEGEVVPHKPEDMDIVPNSFVRMHVE